MATFIPSDFRTLPTPTAFVPLAPPALAFTQSSQFQNWRFSREQLAVLREGANRGARRRVAEAWASAADGKGKGKERELEQAQAQGGEEELNADPSSPSNGSAQPPLPFPSVSDELELIKFYLGKVPGLTRALALPEFVGAAAMSYMKRFYLRNSCLEWHPKHIMLTCLFLATKTENVPMSLHNFAYKVGGKAPTREAVDESARSIREHEFLVSQSLQFEFMLWGAGRALAGLMADVQLLDPPLPVAKYHELTQAAQEPLALSRLTDAEFFYTPAQIALTCVRAAEVKVLGAGSGASASSETGTGTKNGSSHSMSMGIGQLGSLTQPYLLNKEERARKADERAREERDALRKVDQERLAPYLPSSSSTSAKAGQTVQGAEAQTADGEGAEGVQASSSSSPPLPPAPPSNPALALSHEDGSLLAVLDQCALLIQTEASLKCPPGSAAAAAKMEKVKAIDRDIKACKVPSAQQQQQSGSTTPATPVPATTTGRSEEDGNTQQAGRKRAGGEGGEEEAAAESARNGDEEEPAQKRARTGGSG
ncbi:unnamed protein product [Tilletia laevis]|uniref:Cyclin-like domain-containing protein n=2 Tax=Tilletia TaxID=13289 RepID=A0A8X7MN57_9BASI|nr:hypothetical protein CF335_g5915 [Tilletia laevis]KAE8242382.1 hypothetical protein A4X06_0g6950 [Tilletia controversa]KAE8253858.1 hypothetical protein A4X03_0g5799 [Tilletia caries]KAE8196336.1 hypothetical protein CF336_g2674 [Tilletia laevis]CAD6884448.1 unnamed protein product [Tilletia caries]